MTFGKRVEQPNTKRSALTLRCDHDAQVQQLITEAIQRVALRRGLILVEKRPCA